MVVGQQQQQQQKIPRRRIIFTQAQLAFFEQEYVKNPYASQDRQQFLAHQLGITKDRVKIWFQNRRAKDKRSQTDHPVVVKRKAGQMRKEMEQSEAEELRRTASPEEKETFGGFNDSSLIRPFKKEIHDDVTPSALTPRKRRSPQSRFQQQQHFDPMYPYNNYLLSMSPGLQMLPQQQQPFSYSAQFGMLPNTMPQFINPTFQYQIPTPPFSPFLGLENIVQPVVETKTDKGPEEAERDNKPHLTSL